MESAAATVIAPHPPQSPSHPSRPQHSQQNGDHEETTSSKAPPPFDPLTADVSTFLSPKQQKRKVENTQDYNLMLRAQKELAVIRQRKREDNDHRRAVEYAHKNNVAVMEGNHKEKPTSQTVGLAESVDDPKVFSMRSASLKSSAYLEDSAPLTVLSPTKPSTNRTGQPPRSSTTAANGEDEQQYMMVADDSVAVLHGSASYATVGSISSVHHSVSSKHLNQSSAILLFQRTESYARASVMEKEAWRWDITQKILNETFLSECMVPLIDQFLIDEPETRRRIAEEEYEERFDLEDYHRQLHVALTALKRTSIKSLMAERDEMSLRSSKRSSVMVSAAVSGGVSPSSGGSRSPHGGRMSVKLPEDIMEQLEREQNGGNNVATTIVNNDQDEDEEDDDGLYGDDELLVANATLILSANDFPSSTSSPTSPSGKPISQNGDDTDPLSPGLPAPITSSGGSGRKSSQPPKAFLVMVDLSSFLLDERQGRESVRKEEKRDRAMIAKEHIAHAEDAMKRRLRREHLERCAMWAWQLDRRLRHEEVAAQNHAELQVIEAEEGDERPRIEQLWHDELVVVLWGRKGWVAQNALMRTEAMMRTSYEVTYDDAARRFLKESEQLHRRTIMDDYRCVVPVAMREWWKTITRLYRMDLVKQYLGFTQEEETAERQQIAANENDFRAHHLSSVPLLAKWYQPRLALVDKELEEDRRREEEGVKREQQRRRYELQQASLDRGVD